MKSSKTACKLFELVQNLRYGQIPNQGKDFAETFCVGAQL